MWSAGFAFVHRYIWGPSWLRGVVFACAAWLLVMTVAMPLAGKGFFCARLGLWAPAATLMIHAFYGAVLGMVYGWLTDREASSTHAARTDDHLRPIVR